jgi:hypothetical protein
MSPLRGWDGLHLVSIIISPLRGWMAFGYFLLLCRHYVAGWHLVVGFYYYFATTWLGWYLVVGFYYYFATTWLGGIYIKLLGYKKNL